MITPNSLGRRNSHASNVLDWIYPYFMQREALVKKNITSLWIVTCAQHFTADLYLYKLK